MLKFPSCLTCLIMMFSIFSLSAKKLPKLREVPWISDEAVYFLDRFLEENPDAAVLEFGSGASTLWLAKRTRNLVSLEHSSQWSEYIQRELSKNNDCHPVDYLLYQRPYGTVCENYPDEFFDLILVDGRDRVNCIMHSIRVLKKGGILMLDDAHRRRYRNGVKLLKDWECHKTQQVGLDLAGTIHENCNTYWYIKPL